MGGREPWNDEGSLAGIDGDKDYTCRLLYACSWFMYEFVCTSMCQIKFPYLLLLPHPTNNEWEGGGGGGVRLCIAQSMTPGWRVLRSTLKPCTRTNFVSVDANITQNSSNPVMASKENINPDVILVIEHCKTNIHKRKKTLCPMLKIDEQDQIRVNLTHKITLFTMYN